MKPRLLLGLALLPFAVPAPAQNAAQYEIISASCMLAFGRPALGGELIDTLYANKSLTALVEDHREDMKHDPDLQRLVRLRAYHDAYGVPKHLDHITKGVGHENGVTYSELLLRHVEELAEYPNHYREVIDRAYQVVVGRSAYPEEHDYWKTRGTLPYVVLVGAIENWAQRNQPGLMVTTGTPSISVNSRFLTTLRLSLPIANEARTLLGLPVWTDVGRQHSPGNHVVAVGAADIASVGGVHFLVAGGGPLAGR